MDIDYVERISFTFSVKVSVLLVLFVKKYDLGTLLRLHKHIQWPLARALNVAWLYMLNVARLYMCIQLNSVFDQGPKISISWLDVCSNVDWVCWHKFDQTEMVCQVVSRNFVSALQDSHNNQLKCTFLNLVHRSLFF